MLDGVHFSFPRRTLLSHRIEWYLNGSACKRPTFGVYAMACFAEYLLYQTRHGKRNQSAAFTDAARFYAATRRAIQNTLSSYRIESRLSVPEAVSLRRVVADLVNMANDTYEIVNGRELVECPACRGVKLPRADAELLEAILCEQSRNGTIPPSSVLFRGEHLTPCEGLCYTESKHKETYNV